MVLYGQVVIGPPGSGKSTYCYGIQQFLHEKRTNAIVNLDPANDTMSYEAAIDVRDFINAESVMTSMDLGPNGALVYCMKYLEKHSEWLVDKIKTLAAEDECSYFVFDLPGQVELYTHEDCLLNLLSKLQKELDIRLTVVHLVDAHYCTDSYKFISVLLLSLSSMVRLELPHVNILSKVDLINQYGSLAFSLDYYTDVLDLQYLLNQMNADEKMDRFKRMNEALVEVVEDFSLVRFLPLNISDGKNLCQVLRMIDKCNGCSFMAEADMTNIAISDISESNIQETITDIQEKFYE